MDPKILLFLPLFGLMILSLGSELSDIAQTSSEKSVSFANDMNGAMDCAFRGIPIEECSPTLMDHDFEPEINQTVYVLNTTLTDIDWDNATITEQGYVLMKINGS